jgi:hypothetical protein
MLGRTLLAPFGGTAAVWTTCLAAYQTLLLAGYLYAHRAQRWPQARQRRVHVLLLGLAALWTFVLAATQGLYRDRMGNSGHPAFEVLLCVLILVGLPYVLLAAGSTLVQAWLSKDGVQIETGTRGRGIYKLYAVSNLGSFLGLLAYPFVFEPHVPLTLQWWGFGVAFAAYTLLLWRTLECGKPLPLSSGAGSRPDGSNAGCQPMGGASNGTIDGPQELAACQSGEGSPHSKAVEIAPHSRAVRLLWFVIPGVSVLTLNAVTTHLTLDVMPLPLLWAILLAAFLLSYVIGFSGFSYKTLPLFLAGTLAFGALTAWRSRASTGTDFELTLFCAVAFCFCSATFLHSWLYQLRPDVKHLTLYYLGNAVGGAAGGLLASIAAPLVFSTVAEYPIALVAVGVMAVLYGARGLVRRKAGRTADEAAGSAHDGPPGRWQAPLTFAAAVAGAVAMVAGVVRTGMPREGDRPVVYRGRGFFGTLQVLEAKARTGAGEGVIREYVHGNTVHGIQALVPGMERMPTTYFSERGGGWAITAHPKYKRGEPMRVNVLGLGVGVILSYARSIDVYRAYEISPEALNVATNPALFTFVTGSPTPVDIACEDARKGLQRELEEGVEPYDVLLIDAFTGDNLPYHLSTREAFELYFKMLKPDGILAVNITNWHLDLDPFVKAVGDAFECPVLGFEGAPDMGRLVFASRFAFFCRVPPANAAIPQGVRLLDFSRARAFPLPTDEKGSFLRLLRL